MHIVVHDRIQRDVAIHANQGTHDRRVPANPFINAFIRATQAIVLATSQRAGRASMRVAIPTRLAPIKVCQKRCQGG